MNGRIRACDEYERIELTTGWECAATTPACSKEAVGSAPSGLQWLPAIVPGTVASSLREVGAWSLDSTPRDFDAEEWWFRLRFAAEPPHAGERIVLGFDGLATLADVWLNGITLLASTNMFIEHRCDVSTSLAAQNELVIRFGPLETHLQTRRPRARWRTPMVKNQQLRWVRTTLLGRTPGWSPPAPPVGPWRPVWLERHPSIELHDLRLEAVVAERRGASVSGALTVSFGTSLIEGAILESAHLVAEREGRRYETPLTLQHASLRVCGELAISDVEPWWPHTHGDPALYQARLRLMIKNPQWDTGRSVEVDLGKVGFRELHLDQDAGNFSLSMNGRKIFCRGACWTPLDCVSLQASGAAYRDALLAVRGAGMNMLRVAGPLVYESDEFLDLCDELGILVWQDFMFANMDYPADDAAFHASVRLEVVQQLSRFQARPALGVLCGNSEGAQQAAMSGAARECWSPPLFETDIAGWSREICASVPYCPSSTHGGAFPHQPGAGVTSYYGVGAYRLPIDDARRSGMRFASECLAFANVPENETLDLLAQGRPLRCHQARWKERVPRDEGAGWDFDDVRDHYLADLYRVAAMPLRYADHDRFLRLGRAVSGEVMALCFAEWRRARSSCQGALVWFLRDLWPGAGWGLIDSTGLPKAAYYYVKRTLQPRALFVTDEGTNGLMIHMTNERAAAHPVRLELRLFRQSELVGRRIEKTLTLDAARTLELPATDLFEGFTDLSYAFRFGPASYDVLHLRLTSPDSDVTLAETFHFPQGLPNGLDGKPGLSAGAIALEGGAFELSVQCKQFAQSVHIEMPGFIADDQYFHMAPQSTRTLHMRPRTTTAARERAAGTVHAINTATVARIAFAA